MRGGHAAEFKEARATGERAQAHHHEVVKVVWVTLEKRCERRGVRERGVRVGCARGV